MGAHEPFRTAAASSLWNNIFDHANRPIVVCFYPEYCSLTNLYYPPSNRGPGLVFSSTAINAGGRLANALVQEFVLHKYTTNANK
jgi:hypothetical protein